MFLGPFLTSVTEVAAGFRPACHDRAVAVELVNPSPNSFSVGSLA